ncbi:MAG: methylornithine synthase PylB [Candidatus Adiutrix sp.]|jgi:methylornithine synthase|nr:methylornithine synthase PylB [Candidatus Adiutrix sp.]
MARPLTALLSRILAGSAPTRTDLVTLLSLTRPEERAEVQTAARAQRARHSGDLIHTYGFVYIGTFCRNACRFCAFRRDNPLARRYRLSQPEILAAARDLASQGVNLIDLTLGEDQKADQPDFFRETAELIRQVARVTGLPVMVSPGVAEDEALTAYRKAGATWYACYQETHNRGLFSRLRPGQSYDRRWSAKLAARTKGLLVEEGVLCGAGESAADLADSVLAMMELGAEQVRGMAYMPPPEAAGTPPGLWTPAPSPGEARRRELDLIAVLRLTRPEALIPASLDVEGLAGLRDRLQAGADVITSLVPAGHGLAGVAQAELDIDNQARSLAGVRPVLNELGLKAATAEDYRRRLKILARARLP